MDKPASLLYYLATRRTWVSRSELACLYRPDVPEAVALGNVRVYLYRARQYPWAQALEIEKTRARYQIATDVQAFLEAAERRAWRETLAIYQGPFLSGLSLREVPAFETWLDLERQELSRKWRTAALQHAQALEGQHDFAGAEVWLARLLNADPLDEDGLQALLRVLFKASKRTQAAAAYRAFCEELRRELDAQPLEATQTLFESLRQMTVGQPEAAAATAQAPRPGPRHNLPAQTTRFIGRKRELAQLSQALGRPECRLLTLLGLGGVGKTRLALEAASRQLDAQADGVWFVPLVNVASPELLASSLAGALEIALAGSSSPRQQLSQFLREKELLLILDNFEHLVTGAGLLEQLLEEAPRLKLLITSRVALELTGEQVVDVEGLAYPAVDTPQALESFDAVKLFNAHAQRRSATFVAQGETLSAVAALTRRVEGLPLALELAATWTRSLSAAQLLAELNRNFDLLSSQRRDLPIRQRSLRTVFDYSWQRLNVQEQTALAQLSVFQSGFTLEAAEQVAAVHLALMLNLINHSLVRRSQEGRFQLHELVRQYAGERLEPTLRADLNTRSSQHHLAVLARQEAEMRGPRQAQTKTSLLQDLDNLRAACQTASNSNDWKTLNAALYPLRMLFVDAGLLQEGRALFEELIAAASNTPGATVARLRLQESRLLLGLGRYSEAIANLQPILPTLAQHGLSRDLAHALWWLGGAYRLMGRLGEAEASFGKCLAVSHDLDDRDLRADLLFGFAALKYDQGQHDEARLLSRECLLIRKERGDLLGIADAEVQIAQHLIRDKNDLLAAGEYLQHALASARQVGALRLESMVLNTLAALAFRNQEYLQSEQLYLEALGLARQLGVIQSQITNLGNLGNVLNDQQRYHEAFNYLFSALELCQQFGRPDAQVHLLFVLGENAWLRGEGSVSRDYFSQAIECAISADIPGHSITQGLHLLASVYGQAGLHQQALTLATFLLDAPETPKALSAELASMTKALQGRRSAQDAEQCRADAKALTLNTLLAMQQTWLAQLPSN